MLDSDLSPSGGVLTRMRLSDALFVFTRDCKFAYGPVQRETTKMTLTEFTPIPSLLGGALIGGAAVLLMAVSGRIAGISGIASRLLPPYLDREWLRRIAFILGLVLAPLVYGAVLGRMPLQSIEAGLPLLGVAGLLVGFGSVWGNGCTSGHGVCGLSRLSPRSLVATLIFMTTAAITVFIIRHAS